MSLGKYILIDPQDCPSRHELQETITRLYKDAELLSCFSSKKNASPESLRATANFLERIFLDNRLKQIPLSDEAEQQALNDIATSKVSRDYER